MAVSVACQAADCVWHRNGMCDKAEITVSPGPNVQCMDYQTAAAGQMPSMPMNGASLIAQAMMPMAPQGGGTPY